MYGKTEIIIPSGMIIDGVCGDGETTAWVDNCILHKFEETEKNTIWACDLGIKDISCGDSEIIDAIDEISDAEKVTNTGFCIASGPYCGLEVKTCFSVDGDDNSVESISFVWDPATGNVVLIDTNSVEMKRCDQVTSQSPYELERFVIQVCSDVDEGIEHTYQDIVDLIIERAEEFNISGDLVDLSGEQEIIYLSALSFHCDSVIKKPDGSEFKVFSDNACVILNGATIFQLFNGGMYSFGGGVEINNPSEIEQASPISMNESVFWPCGSGGFYCIDVRNPIDLTNPDNK